MFRCWQYCRGGMSGPGHLPDEGGILDQSIVMLEAFDIMSAQDAIIQKRKG